MKTMIKIFSVSLTLLLIVLFIGCNSPYKYDNELVANYITTHAESKSRCMCAWYCMKAIRNGGCFQCGILPAYSYNKLLPQLGFKEVSITDYVPQKGDISVLPKNSGSAFGHIAIYNGEQWISDFKQSSIFPGTKYREKGKYQIFRISNGWHFSHIFISPKDMCQYIKDFINGMHKIKWLS